METQKILNLLNGSNNENSKFSAKQWHAIDSESKGKYSHHHPLNFLTKLIELSLCDYSDAYILVTGNFTVKRRNAANTADITLGEITRAAFKNCALFLMVLLLMKQILLILQCQCRIWLNIVTIILILQEVYGILKR